MFKKININGKLKRFDDFKLCFISPIPETILVDSPESVAFQKTKEYKELRTRDKHWYTDYRLRMIDIPNPEFDRDKTTHNAYFTPLSLDVQWGDDWNDSLQGSYADLPYDHDDNGVPIEILVMQFSLNLYPFEDDNFHTQWSLPDDISRNICTRDVNRGIVPWLYAEFWENKDFLMIHAGVPPQEFAKKLKDFKKRNGLI